MLEKIKELIKKFERNRKIYVDTHDEKSYWILTTRIPKKDRECALYSPDETIRFCRRRRNEWSLSCPIQKIPSVSRLKTGKQWKKWTNSWRRRSGESLTIMKDTIRACRNRMKPGAPEIIPPLIMAGRTLPPSSKIVLEVLDSGETMTQKDLVERTRLSPRTVRYGLKRLVERDLIIRKLNLRDARQIIYQTSPTRSSDPIRVN